MPQRYLRQREDGFIYEWNEIMAEHPKMEEVTEQEAYPERFVKGGKRKALVDLTTDELIEAPSSANALLGISASKGLPK